jgi:hypothetical protein
MRFVIVSDRAPRSHLVCAHCAKPIAFGYLRSSRVCRIVITHATGDAVVPSFLGLSQDSTISPSWACNWPKISSARS